MSLSLLKKYERRLSFGQDFRRPFAEPEGNLMTVSQGSNTGPYS